MKKGKSVKLVEMPTGYESQHYDVEVGKVYIVEYVDGCCLCVTDGESSYTINENRFEEVS